MKIYTKTGDKGQTSLLGGTRTSKADLRVWAYGTIDEFNSSIGFAKSLSKEEDVISAIVYIQKSLFEVAAELASLGCESYKERINSDYVVYLENLIDKLYESIPAFKGFILPGGCEVSGALDVARTKIRCAERYIVELEESYSINQYLLKYVNRLSDAVYALARYEDYVNIKKAVIDRVKNNAPGKFNREIAEILTKHCIEKAIKINVPMVICISDSSGNPIVIERMDNALLASVNIAQRKAYTAIAFKTPTEKLYDESKPDGQLYGINNLDNVITFGGGVPLFFHDKLLGAIGVSGGTVEEDMSVCYHGYKIFKEMICNGAE